jgi:hypothetical protein
VVECPTQIIGLTSLLQIIYSTGAKGSTQTNKKIKLGFKFKEQKKPKCALVWHTGLSGVPPDSVRCTRPYNSELLSFGFLRRRSAIIHRTVRSTSRATAPAQRSTATDTCKSAIVRAESEQPPEGASDSAQYLSGAT